jgi:hypothetical protein
MRGIKIAGEATRRRARRPIWLTPGAITIAFSISQRNLKAACFLKQRYYTTSTSDMVD